MIQQVLIKIKTKTMIMIMDHQDHQDHLEVPQGPIMVQAIPQILVVNNKEVQVQGMDQDQPVPLAMEDLQTITDQLVMKKDPILTMIKAKMVSQINNTLPTPMGLEGPDMIKIKQIMEAKGVKQLLQVPQAAQLQVAHPQQVLHLEEVGGSGPRPQTSGNGLRSLNAQVLLQQ